MKELAPGNKPKAEDKTSNQGLEEFLANKTKITTGGLVKNLGIKKSEAEAIIKRLMGEGRLFKTQGGIYKVVEEAVFENLPTEEKPAKKQGGPNKKQGTVKEKAEVLPPGVLGAKQLKSIVFDLLEEEGKTPESYEITRDAKGIQTFVLKFTDGTTNEHSVRGVLGLRLNIPIFDIEGIEPVGDNNFRLIYKQGEEENSTEESVAKEEQTWSEKHAELEKLRARKKEIADIRASLLERLSEIEKTQN